MGMNFSFEIIFPREKIDDVLIKLSEIGGLGFSSSMTWKPVKEISGKLFESGEAAYVGLGISGLPKRESYSEDLYEYGTGFEIPVSLEKLYEWEDYEYPYGREPKMGFFRKLFYDSPDIFPDSIDVSPVEASVYVGKKWGVLDLSAPGSRMSRLFVQSSDVKEYFVTAFSSVCKFVLLNVEGIGDHEYLLFPEEKEINSIDEWLFYIEDSLIYSPDHKIEKLIEEIKEK